MNPILALVLKSGIHYPPNLTSDIALQSILNELNTIGNGISAWLNCGIIVVEIANEEENIQIVVGESKADIRGPKFLLDKPMSTLIAFAVIHAIEKWA